MELTQGGEVLDGGDLVVAQVEGGELGQPGEVLDGRDPVVLEEQASQLGEVAAIGWKNYEMR